jgi:hypothetical protein
MRLYLKAIYSKTHILVITQLINFRCGTLWAVSDIGPLRDLVCCFVNKWVHELLKTEKRDKASMLLSS